MFVIPVARHAAELSRQLERHRVGGQIERLFTQDPQALALRSPALDVSESASGYTVLLDLPGVSKEAVKISIEGRRVSIDAEQTRDPELAEGEKLLHRERAATRFSRSLQLPQELNQNECSAKLENGVLTLKLSKLQANGPTQLIVS